MIRELDVVVLTRDLPAVGLTAGDIGTVVLVHHGRRIYEVEFTTFSGETLAVLTLSADALRPIGPRDVAHIRVLA